VSYTVEDFGIQSYADGSIFIECPHRDCVHVRFLDPGFNNSLGDALDFAKEHLEKHHGI
jgi:hypothetical protein